MSVAGSSPAEATLAFDDLKVLDGVIVDDRGNPAAGASINCMSPGVAGLPEFLRGETDDRGAFSISLPVPLPQRLNCGVATRYGAIASFIVTPGENIRLGLPQATATMKIADWGERVSADRFWLIATDGRLFNISWAAATFGTAWSPLTISRLPAGHWRIVRADSTTALSEIARGMARALPLVTDVQLDEGETTEVRIQNESAARR